MLVETWDRAIPGAARTARLSEVPPQCGGDEVLIGILGENSADHSVGIAVLKPTRQHEISGNAAHHSKPTGQGDASGELPARDADAHAALDDFWQRGGAFAGGEGSDVHAHATRTYGTVGSALRAKSPKEWPV